ncbi:dihydroorotate dehydrogenase-like protein [Adhaeretor mobilis]|uniref:Dihydroorotate dehydrogenase B (NAD(+)), catalytic subunit n=1 Tax=Adhaeretor mobilis TaxID=1930276 RepID=A0A517MZF2_9BACT|nr:dihydroorotate dehydrogenase-like protein [Adhaeretor mobilis]QDT00257.1 Dihydroorotate dehydrogenase B (NAD(+)), catalytic subunit [Adhaeretor mobilis]
MSVVDFSTEYLGMTLRSPIIASSSPCTGQPDVLRRMEEFGAGAAVLPSLFEEQVARDTKTHEALEAMAEFPTLNHYNSGPENYVSLVEKARAAVTMPIIASLNGASLGGWIEYARRIRDAGADAIELNLYFVPIDPSASSTTVEARYLDVIAAVRQKVEIPLSVKIGPYFSSLPYFARQVQEAGADGLVLFNRFLEPDIDLESHKVAPHLELSHPSEARLSLRWLGVLHDQLQLSLAASSGIHNGTDALKAMAAGANVVMLASTLLQNGVDFMQEFRDEMLAWLAYHEYKQVRQLIGTMSRKSCGSSAVFERANYAATLASYIDEGVAVR